MSKPVYLLLDSRSAGGIESHVLILATLLQQHCAVKVLLWRLYDNTHPLLQQLDKKGISYQVLQGRFALLLNIWRASPEAILHCHGYKANLLGRLAAFWLAKRCVSTFHNGDRGTGKVRLYTWLDEWSSRWSTNIAVSQNIVKRLLGHCHYLPNAVSVPVIAPQHSQRSGGIAFVGRLESVKRPDRFCQLAQAFPTQQFVMFGSGSLAAHIAQIKPANVRLMGLVETMQPFWASLDLLVICSDDEGFPMVALEAMAAGVPVLTLPLGDLPTLIRHQRNGFLADNTEELACQLQTWLSFSAVEQSLMRQQAHQTIAQGFGMQQFWTQLSSIYQAV